MTHVAVESLGHISAVYVVRCIHQAASVTRPNERGVVDKFFAME